MRKVIFLDVDGVLNSNTFEQWLYENHVKKYYGYELLDQKAILCLQDIVFTTDAEIVLSSSWRLSTHMTKMLEDQLRPYALAISSFTQRLVYNGDRGEEITAWLKDNPDVTHYVILDDEFEMADHKEHFVKTTMAYGLLPEHANRAIEILTNS